MGARGGRNTQLALVDRADSVAMATICKSRLLRKPKAVVAKATMRKSAAFAKAM